MPTRIPFRGDGQPYYLRKSTHDQERCFQLGLDALEPVELVVDGDGTRWLQLRPWAMARYPGCSVSDACIGEGEAAEVMMPSDGVLPLWPCRGAAGQYQTEEYTVRMRAQLEQAHQRLDALKRAQASAAILETVDPDALPANVRDAAVTAAGRIEGLERQARRALGMCGRPVVRGEVTVEKMTEIAQELSGELVGAMGRQHSRDVATHKARAGL